MPDQKPCQSCGTSIDDSARFCSACGAEQLAPAAQTPAAPAPAQPAPPPRSGRRWRMALYIGAGVVALLVVLYIIGSLTDDDDEGGGGGTVGDAGGFQVSEVYQPADPADPMLSRFELAPGDGQPVEAIEVFGSRGDSGPFPETELVYLQGIDEPIAVDLDASGLPDEVRTPEGITLKFEFDGDTALMHYLAPDGRFGVESREITPDIRAALDSVAAQARVSSPPGRSEPLVSAYPDGVSGSAHIAATPLPPEAPPNDMNADVNIQAVRRAALIPVTATDADGQDVTKAICCFSVNSSGEQHTSHQLIRNDQGLFVQIIHEVPVSTVLNRLSECEGPNWWLVGGLLVLALIGSMFGAPILVALGMGQIEAGIFAGLGAPLIGALATYDEAARPTCVQTVTEQIQQEYWNRETTVEICPVSFQLEGFQPACRTASYRPWDPARPDLQNGIAFQAHVPDDAGELEVCKLGSGSADPSPRFLADVADGDVPPHIVAGPAPPVSYFAPPGHSSPCGEDIFVDDGGEPTPAPVVQDGYYPIQVLSFGNMTLAVRTVEEVESGELLNCNFLHGGLCHEDDPPAEIRVLAGPFETDDEARAWLCERMTNIHPPPLAAGLVADFEGQTVSTEVGC